MPIIKAQIPIILSWKVNFTPKNHKPIKIQNSKFTISMNIIIAPYCLGVVFSLADLKGTGIPPRDLTWWTNLSAQSVTSSMVIL